MQNITDYLEEVRQQEAQSAAYLAAKIAAGHATITVTNAYPMDMEEKIKNLASQELADGLAQAGLTDPTAIGLLAYRLVERCIAREYLANAVANQRDAGFFEVIYQRKTEQFVNEISSAKTEEEIANTITQWWQQTKECLNASLADSEKSHYISYFAAHMDRLIAKIAELKEPTELTE